MGHILKEKWHSFLVSDSDESGATPDIQNDQTDHVMDLTKMKDNGDLDDGKHGGNLLKGKATQIAANSFFVYLDEYQRGKVTRHYEGFLVRNKSFGGQTLKLLAGRYIIFNSVRAKTRKGPFLVDQEEGTWVATKP